MILVQGWTSTLALWTKETYDMKQNNRTRRRKNERYKTKGKSQKEKNGKRTRRNRRKQNKGAKVM
jgi:hypothetical protein